MLSCSLSFYNPHARYLLYLSWILVYVTCESFQVKLLLAFVLLRGKSSMSASMSDICLTARSEKL